MKKLMILSIALGGALTLTPSRAGDAPRGNLLELHSCELFAGGCVVSSQATLDGRYMLQAWDFSGGSFAGVELAGLQLAVLQSSSQNLAAEKASSEQAVVYLPEKASASQRKALLAWVKTTQPHLKTVHYKTKVASLRFAKDGAACSFRAGDSIRVNTASLESCEKGGCGEALWYSPRGETTLFTVAVDSSSEVNEPLLKLNWRDANQRSVFLGKFGEKAPGKNVFVTTEDFCGRADKLF
jgi:hypothetical protein